MKLVSGFIESTESQINDIGRISKRENLAEDIRKACLEKRAFLFMDDSKSEFVVLRPMPNKVVQIWVAWSNKGRAIARHI